ncbi:MAG: hypothetical protein K0R73_106 [Candidatus Midichloriaceae bacterium]|jgi:hypothetical protein|nr:hypothetical protein [Candidatus Midichloriaceae bacterium]
MYKRKNAMGIMQNLKVHPSIIFLVLAICNWFIAFPGFLTADSWGQYVESHNLNFSNHHPASMSILWHYVNKIWDGSPIMLLISLSLLWLSSFLFYLKARSEKIKFSWVYFVIPFTPAILGTSAIIWKDVIFAHLILIAVSLCYFYSNRSTSRSYQVLIFLICLALIFLGSSMKFQARFIVIFLFLILAYAIFQFSFKNALLAAFISTAIFASFYIGLNHINNVKDTGSQQLRQFFDIAGISVCKNKDLFPEYVRRNELYSFEKVKEYYEPAYVNPYTNPAFGDSYIYPATLNVEHLAELEKSFYSSALLNPHCYILHRLRVFHFLIKNKSPNFKNFGSYSLPLELKTKLNYEDTFYHNYINPYIQLFSLLTRGYIFIILDIIFAIVLYKKFKLNGSSQNQCEIFYALLLLTNLAFYLTLFFTVIATDNRYLYYSKLITSFLIPIFLQKGKEQCKTIGKAE